MPDAAQRLLRERQREVALDAGRAPRGQAPLERDGLSVLTAGDAAARVEGCAASIFKPAQRARLPPPEPLAHRLDCRAELASGRLDAVLAGEAHQLEAEVDGVFTLPEHGVISQRTHRSNGPPMVVSQPHS